jgi:ribosomal-protein-serine acetyltransferase
MFEKEISDELSLSLLQISDADDLFRLTETNRARLREWLPWLDFTKSVDDSRAFIRMCLSQLADNKGFACGIRHRRELVGVVSYHPINWTNRSVALGYWIGQTAEGKGLVTLAVKAMTTHAFETLGLNRVELRCASGNVKSQRIPQKLGFQFEGVSRQPECLYGKFVDHHVYAALAAEWNPDQNSAT